jgi:hypothetical protein
LINVALLAFRENLLIGVKVLWRMHTTVVMGSEGRGWVERVARMAKDKCVQVFVGVVKGKDHLEDLGVDGRVILY